MRKRTAGFSCVNHFIIWAKGKGIFEPQNFFGENFVVRRQEIIANKIINRVKPRRIEIAYAAKLNPRRFIRRNLQRRAAFSMSARVEAVTPLE